MKITRYFNKASLVKEEYLKNYLPNFKKIFSISSKEDLIYSLRQENFIKVKTKNELRKITIKYKKYKIKEIILKINISSFSISF
jgi:hypothetical protein